MTEGDRTMLAGLSPSLRRFLAISGMPVVITDRPNAERMLNANLRVDGRGAMLTAAGCPETDGPIVISRGTTAEMLASLEQIASRAAVTFMPPSALEGMTRAVKAKESIADVPGEETAYRLGVAADLATAARETAIAQAIDHEATAGYVAAYVERSGPFGDTVRRLVDEASRNAVKRSNDSLAAFRLIAERVRKAETAPTVAADTAAGVRIAAAAHAPLAADQDAAGVERLTKGLLFGLSNTTRSPQEIFELASIAVERAMRHGQGMLPMHDDDADEVFRALVTDSRLAAVIETGCRTFGDRADCLAARTEAHIARCAVTFGVNEDFTPQGREDALAELATMDHINPNDAATRRLLLRVAFGDPLRSATDGVTDPALRKHLQDLVEPYLRVETHPCQSVGIAESLSQGYPRNSPLRELARQGALGAMLSHSKYGAGVQLEGTPQRGVYCKDSLDAETVPAAYRATRVALHRLLVDDVALDFGRRLEAVERSAGAAPSFTLSRVVELGDIAKRLNNLPAPTAAVVERTLTSAVSNAVSVVTTNKERTLSGALQVAADAIRDMLPTPTKRSR